MYLNYILIAASWVAGYLTCTLGVVMDRRRAQKDKDNGHSG